MLIKEIINMVDGELLCGSYEASIEEIKQDSRTIQKGDTFICFIGENMDGHDFLPDAIRSGASVCIVSRKDIKLSEDTTILYVEDTTKTLNELISYKFSEMKIPVVAITGSVGKTSTKELIADILSNALKTFKSPKNFNSLRGLPLACSSMTVDTEIAVVEMGMNHLNEISTLSKIIRPNIALITNIGSSHIGILGSSEKILEAKLEIIDGLKENGILFLNNDDPLLHEYVQKIKKEKKSLPYYITTYGIKNNSDIMATNIQTDGDYTEFEVEILDKKEKFKTNIVGMHNVYNALASIAIAKSLNVTSEDIEKSLMNMKKTARRMEKFVTYANMIIYDDSYNASYESIKAAMDLIKNKKYYGRKVAILGDILELGDFAEYYHKKVGEEFLKNDFDVLITVGENSKFIESYVKENKGKKDVLTYHFETVEEVNEDISKILKKDDIVLIKASNGMHFNKIADFLRNYEVDPCHLK